ncbi:MAG: hypothetical protein ACREHD_13250, partial [Pirellulales bacterium]
MRSKLKKFWRYRPRLLTVALLIVIAAMLVLANLTDEIGRRGPEVLAGPGQVRFSRRDPGPVDPRGPVLGLWSLSYGWPLLWRQYILAVSPVGPYGVLGECYSAGRLASNLAIWLVTLAAPGAACEWLLRRYRPRFRWSLRTMLAATGLAGALCGWSVAARNRADLQDAVVAAQTNTDQVWTEHWGPKWLDLPGADRYRRRIVGAKVDLSVGWLTDEWEAYEEDAYEEEVKRKMQFAARLARLRGLQYLFIEVDRPTPAMADALSKLRKLRVLSIHIDEGLCEDERILQECLTAIGAMPELEHLSLFGVPFASESLAGLAGLTNLKSLRLQINHHADEQASDGPLLSRLPPLPRLEAVDLQDSYVGDRGLRYLSVLPRLKTLNLILTDVAEREIADSPRLKFNTGVANLADLEFLEEVAVMGDTASATSLESLLALKRLKKLHFGGPYIE